MEADYEAFEIVCVIGGHKLIDSESYERRYWAPDTIPLPPGYYVVHWPAEVRRRRFDHHAWFHGPFARKAEARNALDGLAKLRESELAELIERGRQPRRRRDTGTAIPPGPDDGGSSPSRAVDRLRGLLNRKLNFVLHRPGHADETGPGPDAAERFPERNPGFFAPDHSSRDNFH